MAATSGDENAGDRGAEDAYQALRRNYVAGRISLAEFEERVEALYSRYAPEEDRLPVPTEEVRAVEHPRRAVPVKYLPVALVVAVIVLIGASGAFHVLPFVPVWPILFWLFFAARRAPGRR